MCVQEREREGEERGREKKGGKKRRERLTSITKSKIPTDDSSISP